MPGTALYDFGDFVRDVCCSAAEDEQDMSKVNVDDDLIKAATQGYIITAREFLAPKELKLLEYAPLVLSIYTRPTLFSRSLKR